MPQATRTNDRHEGTNNESGAAIIEFIFLATALFIPAIYLLVFIGLAQSGGYAAVAIADQSAHVISQTPGDAEGRARSNDVMARTGEDYGFDASRITLNYTCSHTPCSSPGSEVRTEVEVSVGLPLVPSLFGTQTSVITMRSESFVKVGEFE